MSKDRQGRSKARIQRQIAALIENPAKALKAREYRSRGFARAFLQYCGEMVVPEPSNGRLLASLAIRVAHRSEDKCLWALAFGILASWHRAQGQLKKAEVALRVAFDHACLHCSADLKVRSAAVRRHQERYDDALEEIAEALELYETAKDSEGQGRALLCRGSIHHYSGDVPSAVRDFGDALALISPEQSPSHHRAAVFNLTAALAVGKVVDAETALRKLQKVKPLFKGLRGFSAERAKLRWLEGLIMIRLGCDQRAEGLLRTARDSLIELRMPQEVAAITADLALLCHTDRRAVRSLARNTAQLTWATAHQDIGPKIVAFAQATAIKNVSAAQLRTAATSLRLAAGDCGIAAPAFA